MLPLLIFIAGFFDEPKATADDYQLYITKFEQLSEKIFNQKNWDQFEIIDKKTQKANKFNSLSEIEKKTFIIALAQQVSAEMAKIQKAWENELDLYKNPEYKSTNPKVCKPSEIEVFIRKLVDSRKKMANQFEQFINEYCKEFEKEVTEPELKVLSKNLKKFHDSFNLVPRKKE